MYVIAIAWVYVILLVAISDTTIVGGVLTFLFAGVLPLGLFLWLAGTPARRRRRERTADNGSRRQDGANSNENQ